MTASLLFVIAIVLFGACWFLATFAWEKWPYWERTARAFLLAAILIWAFTASGHLHAG